MKVNRLRKSSSVMRSKLRKMMERVGSHVDVSVLCRSREGIDMSNGMSRSQNEIETSVLEVIICLQPADIQIKVLRIQLQNISSLKFPSQDRRLFDIWPAWEISLLDTRTHDECCRSRKQ